MSISVRRGPFDACLRWRGCVLNQYHQGDCRAANGTPDDREESEIERCAAIYARETR